MILRPERSSLRTASQRFRTSLLAALCVAPLAAQGPGEIKLLQPADPVKGAHDTSPLAPTELAALRDARAPHARLPGGSGAPQLPRQVLFDRPGDGHLWAASPSYKASFGADGFVYVPFFGSQAPRNHPVQFQLATVRVGDTDLPLADAEPLHDGMRVTFDRGAVRERYDLGVEGVEQTFVIDGERAGAVDVVLRVTSELREDAARAGIQFGNELGLVEYGQAHVVRGEQRIAVATTWEGNTIRIHVPAELRGEGPLVIDPLVSTGAFSQNFTNNSSQPDIAYDATYDQYLVVWQYEFSATDTDVYCEFRNGDGTLVPGSLAIVDSSTLDHRVPRVADLNSADRFLVVMQRKVGALWQIWGRLRLAGAPVHPIFFAISDPASTSDCVSPDIGGDSADSGASDNWLVVWERQLSASDTDIHGRLVRADTSFPGGTLFIENTGNTIYTAPSISQSNGNGFTGTPRWMVVYQFRFSPTDWDIYGAVLSQNGTITASNSPIDTSLQVDLVPCVSSPNTDFAGGAPLFLVTYERQNPFNARARLLSGGMVNQIAAVDLSALFGLGGFWVRPECDGNRFAVLTGAATIGVATLAYTGSALVLHEAAQPLPGTASYPRLCSKRSGGGPRTEYGIAYVDEGTTPDRILTATYSGHAPGAALTRRLMACTALGIASAGRPFLGETLSFSLSNVGFDIPGFAFGTPVPANTVFCAACPLGVDLLGVTLLVGSSLSIPIPSTASLVGYTAAVQGFALGSGPCAASLRFADTFDFVVQ